MLVRITLIFLRFRFLLIRFCCCPNHFKYDKLLSALGCKSFKRKKTSHQANLNESLLYFFMKIKEEEEKKWDKI